MSEIHRIGMSKIQSISIVCDPREGLHAIRIRICNSSRVSLDNMISSRDNYPGVWLANTPCWASLAREVVDQTHQLAYQVGAQHAGEQ